MTKRDKCIEWLDFCIRNTDGSIFECEMSGCPYLGGGDVGNCYVTLMIDALALLKEQEPNEDWISRKHLKDEIQYYIDEAGWGDEVNKVLGWCMEFIDNQMAVKWE